MTSIWEAVIPTLPGCIAYGSTEEEAKDNVMALLKSMMGGTPKEESLWDTSKLLELI